MKDALKLFSERIGKNFCGANEANDKQRTAKYFVG